MDLTFIQSNIWLFLLLALWEVCWKGLALWKAARREQRYWFIALLFINSAGVLPVIYLLMYSYGKDSTPVRWHL